MVPDHADPARGLIVREVTLRDFRSYSNLEVALEPGLVLVSGPNGAGKTNLLEALHVGTQGFSPRTRSAAQLVRLGAQAARVRLRGTHDGVSLETELALDLRDARRARLNGERLPSADHLRQRLRTLVFTPDRLAVVKAGPAARRAYLDRAAGRLFPSRALLPLEYGSALGQRNAALRRVAAGLSSADALAPWTAAVAALGAELVELRRAAVAALAGPFAETAALLGLARAVLAYEEAAPSAEEHEHRLALDLERGMTGLGPHLHEVSLAAGGRELRRFGSQGEQRIAVLALVLAEAAVLRERHGASPLVLLDDVLSELDERRRRALAELVAGGGQTVITATSAAVLPLSPAQELAVRDGEVRPV
ncbi:MAG TPA: DNA replication and repair protein RecF [Gaiellaceae bacterium]|nr:DNA replication and repair protein RecF [Gaiellaceae bacterium]